jgi:hypothetical protein
MLVEITVGNEATKTVFLGAQFFERISKRLIVGEIKDLQNREAGPL